MSMFEQRDDEKNATYFIRLVMLSVTALVILYVLFASWYTVNQGERGILKRFGNVVEVSGPGLHAKFPFIDSVTDMSVQTEKLVYTIQVYSEDAQPIEVNISVNYRIADTAVESIYTKYGMSYVQRIIVPQILSIPKIAFGKFSAVNIVKRRDTLTADMTDMFITKFADSGIVIESVQIENIDFSDEYEKSVEKRMRAEVMVEEAEQDLKKEEKLGQIKRIKADADAYQLTANAKAVAAATIIQGDAEAKAIEAKSAAMSKNPQYVEMIKAEKWNGVLPTTMVPNNSIPIIGK